MAQRHVHREKNPLKMEVEIRSVKAGDEAALAYVNTESWKAAFSEILSKETLDRVVSYEKAVNLYKGLIEEEKGNGYLLFLDKEPHCMAWWDKARDEDMTGKAELICIHSLSGNWGKGYGSMMMERILTDIRDAGYPDVVLWVFTDNNRARRFYEKHGFQATDSVRELLGVEEVRYYKRFKEEKETSA